MQTIASVRQCNLKTEANRIFVPRYYYKNTAMRLSLDPVVPTSQEWVDAILSDFDSFLIDHCDCERKASGMAMGMIAKYPNRTEIIPELMETAIEELEHYRDVYGLMQERGLQLPLKVEPDPYIKAFHSALRGPSELRFLDRLLQSSIIEMRGCERFRLVAENVADAQIQKFYKQLWTTEAKHGHIFVRMALRYFPEDEVYDRLETLNTIESEIVSSLPIRSALH